MTKSFRLLSPLFIGGLFLLLDRCLKWQAVHRWIDNKLLNDFFGWHPSYNMGVAFGWPLPNGLTIILTIPIIILIAYLLYKNYQHFVCNFSLSFTLIGALSNLYDRLIHHSTIDYFLFFTLILNIADVMIVGGLLVYFLYEIKYKRCYF